MATTKKREKVVDRWDAVAISNVTPTAESKKAAEEWNAKHGGKAKKPAPAKKK